MIVPLHRQQAGVLAAPLAVRNPGTVRAVVPLALLRPLAVDRVRDGIAFTVHRGEVAVLGSRSAAVALDPPVGG